MAIINEFIETYGVTILYTILTALAGYVGIAVKNLYKKYINNKTKRDVARTCVRAIEQIYIDLHGPEKLNKCIEAASEMLAERGIHITDIELRMLIEAAVNEFNNGFNKDKEEDEPTLEIAEDIFEEDDEDFWDEEDIDNDEEEAGE